MRDYTLDTEDEQTFISYYNIDDDYIIVHYADGQTEKIPNNNHNERKLLNKMRRQVMDAENYKKISQNLFWANITIDSAAAVFLASEIYLNSISDYGMPISAAALLFLATSATTAYSIITTHRNMTDYNKNKFFIDNEELINEYFYEHKLNINDIQFMDAYELKQIVSNIKKLNRCK